MLLALVLIVRVVSLLRCGWMNLLVLVRTSAWSCCFYWVLGASGQVFCSSQCDFQPLLLEYVGGCCRCLPLALACPAAGCWQVHTLCVQGVWKIYKEVLHAALTELPFCLYGDHDVDGAWTSGSSAAEQGLLRAYAPF